VARGPAPKLRSTAGDFPGIGVLFGSTTLSTTKSGPPTIVGAVPCSGNFVRADHDLKARQDFLPDADAPLRGSRRFQAVRPKASAARAPEDTSILPSGMTSPKALQVKVTGTIS
jgi:hypothetical protein